MLTELNEVVEKVKKNSYSAPQPAGAEAAKWCREEQPSECTMLYVITELLQRLNRLELRKMAESPAAK